MSSTSNLDKVQSVHIDPNGVFKYIQVEVKDREGGTKRIVRGYGWAEYHGACTCLKCIGVSERCRVSASSDLPL